MRFSLFFFPKASFFRSDLVTYCEMSELKFILVQREWPPSLARCLNFDHWILWESNSGWSELLSATFSQTTLHRRSSQSRFHDRGGSHAKSSKDLDTCGYLPWSRATLTVNTVRFYFLIHVKLSWWWVTGRLPFFCVLVSGDFRGGTRCELPAATDPVRQDSPALFWENMEESTSEDEKRQALLQWGSFMTTGLLLKWGQIELLSCCFEKQWLDAYRLK